MNCVSPSDSASSTRNVEARVRLGPRRPLSSRRASAAPSATIGHSPFGPDRVPSRAELIGRGRSCDRDDAGLIRRRIPTDRQIRSKPAVFAMPCIGARLLASRYRDCSGSHCRSPTSRRPPPSTPTTSRLRERASLRAAATSTVEAPPWPATTRSPMAIPNALARILSRSTFSVDDLDAVHARAEHAECQDLTSIAIRPWGERSFYARDPFHTPICFVDSQTLFTAESS